MTVTTRVSSVSLPRSFIDTARIAMMRSPSMIVAVGVDREAAVGVAVVGDAEVGAVLEHGGLQLVEVGRADAVVDVHAVGVGADDDDLGAGVREGLGRDARGGAVGAVEHDLDAVEAVRQRAEQVHDVAVLGVGEPADAADAVAGRRELLLAEVRLDAVFDLVGELRAAEGEELDAVVGRRVVRRGDHHAEVGADAVDQERRRGGRDDAGVEHVDAGAREAGRDRGGEELAGDARVARDDGDRAAARRRGVRRRGALGEHGGSRLGEAQGQVSREFTVGQAPDPVGSEKPRHGRRAGSADQRFENCGALRAFLRPAFLRSMTRASRVRKPAFLSVGAVVLAVDLVERTRDREAQRAGLARGAAAGDLGDHVVRADELEHLERVVDELLVQLVREVVRELTAVDRDAAGAGDEAHAGDGLLAAADGCAARR